MRLRATAKPPLAPLNEGPPHPAAIGRRVVPRRAESAGRITSAQRMSIAVWGQIKMPLR